jgi:phenylalanyl-tRNA synthetase beta chain
MKLSLNTIRNLNKEYQTTGDVAAVGVEELVKKIGAQLGAVEEVIDTGSKYQGIIIAKVVSCEKHPDADKLSLCMIDDGGVAKDVERDASGHVQVVCGAPNVREGLTVAWLPPGATVPETIGKDPFMLSARELRGKVSNGMLASQKELALGDSHDGILEVDGDHKPGTDFAEAFGLANDVVIDIENKMFTHRPDAFGYLGVSRELAGIQGMPFQSPSWYRPMPELPGIETAELKLVIRNEVSELVPRFTAVAMSDVKVGPSPTWLIVELAKLGQKSINNIVDYTNYFMILTGQPLHAYDYDKVAAKSADGAIIVVRHPKPGEKLKLLNGKEIEPRSEAIMIATDQELIGVGGVMGGSETEVDENTTRIILEAATFDMYSVRRTSMAHGLFTDAVTRFTKGQSPLQNLAVQAKIVDEIRSHAGGKIASKLIDDVQLDSSVLERGSLHLPVTVTPTFINQRLGVQLRAEEMQQLLQNVEFIVDIKGDDLIVAAPFWRTDIELREDIVEEVGRLYGYDHLPLELPKRDLTPTARDLGFDTRAAIRTRLSKAGANEILTYSFVHGDLLKKVGQDPSKAFEVANALSPDLQYYRLSLMPSLLDKVHPNIKAGYDEFALFEIGKTHILDMLDDEGLPREFEHTALVVTANDKLKKSGAAYYQARTFLENLVRNDALVFRPVEADMQTTDPIVQPYNLQRSALISNSDGDFLGIIGEFKPSVRRALKLPAYSAGFEVSTTGLQHMLANGTSYTPLSRFPKVSQDITLKVAVDMSYQDLATFVDTKLGANAPDDTHIQLQPVDIFQKDTDAKHKQVTFRIIVTGTNRTLTDKEVSAVLDAIAVAAQSELNAERI